MSTRRPPAPASRDIHFPAEAIAAIAQGQLIAAIKQVREANDLDLRAAKEAVDAYTAGNRDFAVLLSTPAEQEAGNGFPREAEAALARGQLIEAVKIVREKHRLGLKEAKERVDAHRYRHRGQTAARTHTPTSSRDRTDWPRLLVIAAAVCGAVLWWWRAA